MRLFAAVLPPPEAAEHLDDFLSVRRDAAPFRWTAPDQVHLTLAFMADVEPWRLDDLVDALAAAAARRVPTRVRITGGGAFPHPGSAKVLWAGLATDPADPADPAESTDPADPAAGPGLDELGRLAAGARSAAAHGGTEVDGQRFRPHLTVARLARAAEVSRWVRLLDSYTGPPWVAGTVTLVHSHLGEGPRRRPRHEVLAELAVGGTP